MSVNKTPINNSGMLPYNPRYAGLCEQALKDPDSMPQAHDGKTHVFLPKEMPEVVLKQSGEEGSAERFQQMCKARALLKKLGCSHLIIPRARSMGKFLVETRLPIRSGHFYNMGVYCRHGKQFDAPVRELTRLFSQADLSDLVNYQRTMALSNLVGDVVRYDNLPLYVEGNGGKIGLIDLERLSLETKGNLKTLARIFPFHLNVIVEEAKVTKQTVNMAALKDAAATGRKYLQLGYLEHAAWIKKGQMKIPLFHLSAERKQSLAKIVEEELVKLNLGQNDLYRRKRFDDAPIKDFLGKHAAATARRIAPAGCKKILRTLRENLAERAMIRAQRLGLAAKEPEGGMIYRIVNKIKQLFKKRDPVVELQQIGNLSDPERVEIRSVPIPRSFIYDPLFPKPEALFRYDQPNELKETSEQLVHVVIEALVKGGELFSYDPGYNTKGHELSLIRF